MRPTALLQKNCGNIQKVLRVLCLASALFTTVTLHAAEAKPLISYQQALLEAVSNAPTNANNYRERTLALWKWVNEYALEGRYVPVNLTQAISNVLAYPARRRPGAYAVIDHYIRELALLQQDPNAIGSVEASGGPFEAGEYSTLTQTYTVGTKAIQVGGGLVIARHMMPSNGWYQFEDPQAPNYVTVGCSDPTVKLVQDNYSMGGMHGGFRGAIPLPFFRVNEGTLESGETITVTYGDTSQRSPGLRISDIASDFTPFPLYVALDNSQAIYSLPIQPITVTGTVIADVHVFAPSVVKAGESFEISIRAQDQYYNRATSAVPDWTLLLNGSEVASVDSAGQAISVIELDGLDPGIYHPTVRGGSFKGEGNPILVEDEPERYVYWGDTHAHSGFAEGIGSPEMLMQWAKEDARLDFVTHSEHDIWMDDWEWNVLINNVKQYSDERFVAFLGYEWTVQNLQGGHHNVLFRTADGRKRVPAQTHGTLSKLYFGLRQHHDPLDVIVIPHAHQPGDYRLSDPELEPLVEILSQHGTFEWFGRMYLRQGHQVGFTAASDNHMAQPGYTSPRGTGLAQMGGLGAVIASAKSRDHLFDAMKDLSAYATTGDRIILDFSVNDAAMGSRIPFAEDRSIEGRVIGTAPIDEVTIVKNGEEFWSRDHRTISEEQQAMDGTYQIVFASSSIPYHQYDNPRGWRHWRGTLTVQDAEIGQVRGMNFVNLNYHNLEQDGNTVRFSTATRGNTSSILLDLSEASSDTTLGFNLEETRETGGGPPKVRRHQTVPTAHVELSLSDLRDGLVQSQINSVGFTDVVTMRKVRTDGAKVVEFQVSDTGERHGDYYYVRVRQANDAIAYSSPIWIGGFAAK